MKYSKFFTFTIFCLALLLSGCKPYAHLSQAHFERYNVAETEIEGDEVKAINDIIEPYRIEEEREMNTVIATVPTIMTRQNVESTIGNWVADAMDEYIETNTGETMDLSICNYFGIRITRLAAGDLKVGQIYELMPFDNYLVTMEIDGSTLLQLLEVIASNDGWPVSKQLSMTIADGQIQSATLNGQAIDEGRNYRIGLSDYLANGGSNLSFLKDLPYNNTGVYLRDAFIEIAKKHGVVSAELEGRIKKVNP
ncbi:5'-nucleotidase C-terminal domain-containing protein [Membranihabitans marinus]|uniref:5'-nucleotidase C-terminal domain-containing protein n=1 Tax=Membranihabitans marinus TaxID=1227546 RepID=UPI001F30894F|nr:5'-nucleotidase [Membranihabitans marinus]